MFDLTSVYRPQTAMIYNGYCEYKPTAALSPFIRCFWEMKECEKPALIIPDTCMDIVFSFNGSEYADSGFCAIDDSAHLSAAHSVSQFGIRFYAWSACLFTAESFSGTRNGSFDISAFFPDIRRELLPKIMRESTLESRAKASEEYLLKRLDIGRMNSDVMNSIYDMIVSKGTIKTAELAAANAVSVRQLERTFGEKIGVSPKLLSSLIRYQLIWQELRTKPYNALDLAAEFGYSDQSHLLRDFKRFHSLLPSQATAFLSK